MGKGRGIKEEREGEACDPRIPSEIKIKVNGGNEDGDN